MFYCRNLVPGSLALALVLTGCASDQHAHHRADFTAADEAKAAPEMEGHADFFTGSLGVEILLNRAGFAGREGRGGDSASRGGHRGFGGGRGRRGRRGGGDTPPSDEGDASAPHLVAANLPPVRLHLRLTNRGDQPLEVAVTDFDSDLGNFVVQPAKLVIPAHTAVEADPMTSRLGLEAPAIPVAVAICVAGRVEKQTVMLQELAPPPPAPPHA